MALQITGSFELESGIQLNELYARVDANLSVDGNTVFAYPQLWASKSAFDNNQKYVDVEISGTFSYPYNRETDGVDLLDFANKKAKEEFEALGYSVTIVDL